MHRGSVPTRAITGRRGRIGHTPHSHPHGPPRWTWPQLTQSSRVCGYRLFQRGSGCRTSMATGNADRPAEEAGGEFALIV
jgi:hypothetical protein